MGHPEGRLILSEDGLPQGWPRLSLAYVSECDEDSIGVLGWAETRLAQPDGDRAGDPWQWTRSQARIVAWWYAVDDRGRWLYRRGQIVLPKGAGKSPLAAALSCCELAGPVVFAGFDDDGCALGRPHPSPHVQLAAVSQDQTDNTMSLVLTMLRDGEAAKEIPGLDLGLTRVRTAIGKLEPVTASAPSREGQRLTAAILDEPHLWIKSNGGVRLAATLRRNLGKMQGRSIETTNAWMPGEESVAESTALYADKIAEGQAVDVGLLRYHPKAQVRDLKNEAELRAGLEGLYRDSPWINIDRIVAEVQDLGTDVADARRFYLNEVSVAEDGWLAPHEWDACADATKALHDADMVTLGFDGSVRDDSTALVACRVEDGHLELLGCWEKPDGPAGDDWQVDREAVDIAVTRAMERFSVVGFYGDPAHWQDYLDRWNSQYGPYMRVRASQARPLEWWTARPKQMIDALERFHEAAVSTRLSHDGDTVLRRHILNAHRRVLDNRGITIRKPAPSRKIDAAMAATLAYEARADAVAAGLARSRKKRRAVGF